jgi:lysophospholipase L1-like esterase
VPRLALAALVAIAAFAVGAAPALARGASHRDRPAATGRAATGGAARGDGWVGTWSSAQVAAAASGLSATGLHDQTVRDVVHTSVGGSQIRIRLSNVFGSAPLAVDDVRVGLRSSGAAVVAGSDRQVRFGGSRQTTIAAGARRFSDPIKLRVGAGQDLVVSIYFAGATGPATWHPDAISTNYFAAGDQSADTSGVPYTNTDTSWYFLDGVDVLNPAVRGAVVTFGPSTTDGDASTTDANERYPDDLARRLAALPAGKRMSVLNAGISGNQLLADGGTSGVSGLSRFARDAIDQTGVRDIIIWEGSNDIGNNPGLQASQLTDGYAQLIKLAHEHGIRVIGATLQPDEGAGYYTTAGNEVREAVNDWIRTSGAFDGVADFSTVLEDPANPDQLDPSLDSGDHLHPNDAGYQAIADSIDLQLLTGPARRAAQAAGTGDDAAAARPSRPRARSSGATPSPTW